MAITSIKVALVNSDDGSSYSKIAVGTEELCIKTVPDIDFGGNKDRIETTTLCDVAHQYEDGLINIPEEGLSFTANYSPALFAELQNAKYKKGGANKYWGIWFGADAQDNPDGHNGKVSFEGYCEVSLNGFGVGEVTEMTVTIKPSGIPTFSAS